MEGNTEMAQATSKGQAVKAQGGNGATATTVVQTVTDVVELPASLIVLEKDFNARTVISDKRVEEIAASVKKEGQLQPIGVEQRKDGKYSIIFGFTRFRAICGDKEKGGLGKETILARILPTREGVDRLYTNLVENVAREDLTPYDLAIRCEYIKRTFDESGQKIGARIGKSVGYINNLVRAVEKCVPAILERWQFECDPKNEKVGKICTTDWLNKMSKLSEEEQALQLRKALGEEPEEGEEEGEEGEGGSDSGKESVKRAKMKHLKAALDACKVREKDAKKTGDDIKLATVRGAILALEFAIGSKDGIKGIYIKEEEGDEE